MKTILLASAPARNEEGNQTFQPIYALIGKYFYEAISSFDLQYTDGKTWDLYRSGQRLDNFKVTLKGNRFRFEGILK